MLVKLRKIAAVTVTAALVLVALTLAVLFWLVRQEGWLVQSVATGSMEPTIPTGSAILSRPVEAGEVQPGDVIVFESPTGATVGTGEGTTFTGKESMLVTHRVVSIETRDGVRGFRTKGDANDDADPWLVTPDMVRAEYVAHVPVLGGLVTDPSTRRWLFVAIALAGVVVIVAETRTIARELRSDREASRAAAAAAAAAEQAGAGGETETETETEGAVHDAEAPQEVAAARDAAPAPDARLVSGRHRH